MTENKQKYPDCGFFTGDMEVQEPCGFCHYCQVEQQEEEKIVAKYENAKRGEQLQCEYYNSLT